MFKYTTAFSSFSVNDLAKARTFYNKTLGIEIEDQGDTGLQLKLAGDRQVYIYPKNDHAPATFTVLNFLVDNIDTTLKSLEDKGVNFLQYDRSDVPQDTHGIYRGLKSGMGADIAWFEDPAGNVLSIMQAE